ncbi:MAG TPA: ABC transporter permease [Candidatus Limnocylindrales bacterium]|nr:ABC transporter permease [Candidatus Limnocylindrales bacterium]
MSILTSIEVLLQDTRFALRQLRRSPAFTAVAVLTLALGIGANAAIFSVMNAVILRYLPVRDPQQLVYLHTSDFPGGQSGYGDTSLTEPIFEQLRAERAVFTDLMAYVPLGFNRVSVRYANDPEEAWADMVSGNFFTGLGVRPEFGRVFNLEDEKTHAPVAVVSYAYWSTRLGHDFGALGQPLYVKGVPFTIVGVTPRGFEGVEHNFATEVYIPLQTRPDLKPWANSPNERHSLYGTPDWWCLLEIGRLAPGVSMQQAQLQLNPVFQRTSPKRNPTDTPPHLSLTAARGIEGLRDDYQQPLSVLMGMVGLVLVIACANVAMLLMARNAARQREFSLRMAIGCNRVRLFRQLLTESLLLVGAGAVLGWLFAIWATGALSSWSQMSLSLAPDLRVFLFALGISLIAALAFGLAPLPGVVRIPVALVLKSSTANASQDRGKLRSGRIVIAFQIAVCLVLLVGAGLLVRTLRNLEKVNLGLHTDGLFVFGIEPQQSVHSDAEAIHFFQSLTERLRVLPGVESLTLASNRLGGDVSSNTGAYVDGVLPKVGNGSFPGMRWNAVGPDFFHVLGVPIISGRDITDADTASGPKAVVVNKTFADRYLSNQNPIGHHVAFSDAAGSSQFAIVGVVADSKYVGIEETPRPMAYFPYTQRGGIGDMSIELRTQGNPAGLLPEVREAIREIAPEVPLLHPTTQRAQFDETIGQERLIARLALFFGLLAVVLVATGLYGTLAYRVNRRTSEIGVRMALGAQRGQVLWMVLRESLVVCLAGVVVGLPAAYACTRLLRSMLFGLQPSDPLSFVAALGGIILVALLASMIPARRAASVDPMIALRNE